MRVLVCRPREDALATARKLAEAGHEALVAPVIAIVPLPVDVPAGVDALVLTSRHGIESLTAVELDRLRGRPVFAVGVATAAAARARGFADVRVGAGDASSLPDLLALTLPAGGRLLYLAGEVRKAALPEALRAMGYRLEVRDAYEARPAGPWPDVVTAELAAGRVQGCLHYSRRSADLALRAAALGGVLSPFLSLRQACLSADAAGPLAEAGTPDIAVASAPEEAALLRTLSPGSR